MYNAREKADLHPFRFAVISDSLCGLEEMINLRKARLNTGELLLGYIA